MEFQEKHEISAHNKVTLKSLQVVYTILSIAGGSVLGFLSLGYLGLSIGLVVGVLLAFMLRKAFAVVKAA